MLLPLIVRSRWATHAANNCAFNAAKSLASGTGTNQLRRYQPSSPSTPPFSLPLAGLQYSLRYPQCERNAMIRSVSMRDRKSTRLNSSHRCISYAVFCLKKKINVHADQMIQPTVARKHIGTAQHFEN